MDPYLVLTKGQKSLRFRKRLKRSEMLKKSNPDNKASKKVSSNTAERNNKLPENNVYSFVTNTGTNNNVQGISRK